MAKRKPVVPVLSDWATVNDKLGLMCRLEAKRDFLESRMTAAIEEIRSGFQPEVEKLQAEYAETAAMVEQFAKANRADFGKTKSKELRHGIVSFRLSPPSVKTLGKKWPMKSVIEATLARFTRFVRRSEPTLNKERILADYADGKIGDAELEEVGLKINQSETFGIELKIEKTASV